MANGLAVTDVVAVSVTLTPPAAQQRSFGELLILGSSGVIDTRERLRNYSSLTAVANDFGVTALEYLAARLFFSQDPQPTALNIGAWAETDTHGTLHGAVLPGPAQALATFTAVSNGSMTIPIDGVAKTLSGVNLSSALNLNGVASLITTALGSTAIVLWNANSSRFDVMSLTTGIASSVGYAGATGTGTDLSGLLGLSVVAGASAPVPGIAAESPIAAVQILAQNGQWYGLMFASYDLSVPQALAVAAFIEGASPSRMFGANAISSAELDGTQTTSLGYLLKASGYRKTFVQYSGRTAFPVASFFGRAFTVDFAGSNTTLTMKFKQEPGVIAETLTENQAQALAANRVNVFVNYENGTAIVQEGVMSGGLYFDEAHGSDWLQDYVQTAVFNLLYTQPKIPQTDAGIHQIATTVEAAMSQGIFNGFLAPGEWDGPALGSLVTGQFLTKGYYVYVAPIVQQSAADRAARKAPPIQVACKLAGAVHSASVLISINR